MYFEESILKMKAETIPAVSFRQIWPVRVRHSNSGKTRVR